MEIKTKEDNQKFGSNLLKNLMEVFINPEIKKRGLNGSFVLRTAQIILIPGKPPIVRLNDEIKAIADVKLTDGISKSQGEKIYLHEIEDVTKIKLLDDERQKYGHFTIIRVKDKWSIAFDTRWNRDAAEAYIRMAEEFLETSKGCLKDKKYRACVDNLFSASELIVNSSLIIMFPTKNMKHDGIRRTYEKISPKEEYKKTLNKLHGLRHPARYDKKDFNITEEECIELTKKVEEMIEYSKESIKDY